MSGTAIPDLNGGSEIVVPDDGMQVPVYQPNSPVNGPVGFRGLLHQKSVDVSAATTRAIVTSDIGKIVVLCSAGALFSLGAVNLGTGFWTTIWNKGTGAAVSVSTAVSGGTVHWGINDGSHTKIAANGMATLTVVSTTGARYVIVTGDTTTT